MRWKLLRRRLSVSAPRMIVRSHLPWPLRWAAAAVVLGFSAAIALWAFELGKDIAGLDRGDKDELVNLRAEAARLREQTDQARSLANRADSLLKAERAAQERLAEQVRRLEAEKAGLAADLGFFERLLPAAGEGVQLRGLAAETTSPGRLRYQMLVMQPGKGAQPFVGRYDLVISGTLAGQAWAQGLPAGPQALRLQQYARLEGEVEFPAAAVIKAVQARVTDAQGAMRAQQTVKP